MNKVDILMSILLFISMALTIRAAFSWLFNAGHYMPAEQLQMLLTALLLWFVCAVNKHNKDDDWAGEF